MSIEKVLYDKYMLTYMSDFLDNKTKLNLMRVNKDINNISNLLTHTFWCDIKDIKQLSYEYADRHIRKIKNYNGEDIDYKLYKNINSLHCKDIGYPFSFESMEADSKDCYNVTDINIIKFVNLTYLNSRYCKRITDNGIMKLVKLTNLECCGCISITDTSINKLLNLVELNCTGCHLITDTSISKLSNLAKLQYYGCHLITDNSISKLKNLIEISKEDTGDFWF